jgi:hypothetical protein
LFCHLFARGVQWRTDGTAPAQILLFGHDPQWRPGFFYVGVYNAAG